MTILELATQIEQELAKREKDLLKTKEQLNKRGEELLKLEDEITDKESVLKSKEREVEKLAEKVEKDKSLAEREAWVLEHERAYRLKEMELTVWENRLFDIEANQTQEKEKLAEAQRKLSVEKAEYKEKLKKEFFDTLSARV